MFPRLLVTFMALLSTAAAVTSFDAPQRKLTIRLGRSPSGSGRQAKVTCYYFPKFMVKEVDLGEVGADRLAILPIPSGPAPACTRAQGKAEMVVNPDDWSGYFKGVKNNLVFFDAPDGVNGGMGFAVYDSMTGKKIFEDSAVGDIAFLPAQGDTVTISYTRVVDSKCNLPADPAGCWQQIQKTLGLNDFSQPDCKPAYEKSAEELANGRCEAQRSKTRECFDKEIQIARNQTKDATTVMAYPVEVSLGPAPAIKPAKGKLECWPSD